MKKAFLSLLTILLIPVLLSGCGPSSKEHEKLKEEVEKLRIETEALLAQKKELQSEKTAVETEKTPLEPEKESLEAKKADLKPEVDKIVLDSEDLLSNAASLVKSKRYEEAKAAIATLIKTYPGSKEAKASARLTKKIDRAIKKRKAGIERKRLKAEATKRVLEKRKARAKKKKTPAAKKGKTKTMAERDAALEKKIGIAHATRHMKTRSDKREGIKWYHDKNSPLYMDNSSFQVYFGMKKGSKPLLRLRVQHQGQEWLFVKSFTVVADRKKFGKNPAHFNRDKGDARAWEWYDESLTDKDIDMIVEVLSSTKAKVILEGKDKDVHVITSAEKESLKNVLDAYLGVGGEL